MSYRMRNRQRQTNEGNSPVPVPDHQRILDSEQPYNPESTSQTPIRIHDHSHIRSAQSQKVQEAEAGTLWWQDSTNSSGHHIHEKFPALRISH
ncbi:hypothetical protein H5410_023391 [Solanum commersonii]|uniref:Uncharacterized protein n=1 Tax=Solanum commersonii TaxID=4109 RepID=A0A9J5ZK16_SOLCO|nr:hypothetical protein H5410_023391 [Solanum commersonii]